MLSGYTYFKILSSNTQLGKYPMEKLKHVDKPTTIVTDNIERFDEREHGFARAFRGDYGQVGEMMKMSEGKAASVSMMALMSELNLFKPMQGMPPFPSPAAGSGQPTHTMPRMPSPSETVCQNQRVCGYCPQVEP